MDLQGRARRMTGEMIEWLSSDADRRSVETEAGMKMVWLVGTGENKAGYARRDTKMGKSR